MRRFHRCLRRLLFLQEWRLPARSPSLMLSPFFQGWFFERIRDDWPSQQRLRSTVKENGSLRLTYIAAIRDEVVPWKRNEDLFYAIVNKGARARGSRAAIDEVSEITDLGEGGSV